MKDSTIKMNGKGHWEVEYMDGNIGNGFYDMSLDTLIKTLSKVNREVKSITWVKED